MPQTGRKRKKPHVVIVGGGFGGLSAVRALARSPVSVTLIDKRNYHLFRPLLYQVAAGLLSADEVASPLRSVLSKQENTDVLMAEVTGIDVKNRVVQMGGAELSYDYLILALGIRDNYFGHDDWERFAPGLQALDDADRIRGKILSAFEEAERLAALGDVHPEEIQSLLTFVLVGGGTVGVEMASTIAELAQMSLPRDFRHIDADKAKIILFESQPCILPAYAKALSAKAQSHLQRLGVEVRTGTRVESVDASGVIAGGQRVGSRTILWSAGVRPSPAGQWLGAKTDTHGRVQVRPDLSVPGQPNIFVIGDTALVEAPSRNLLGRWDPKPKPLPGVAQPAIQEGRYTAQVIDHRVRNQAAPKPFWYWDKGELAIVGRTYAVAELGFARFAGFFAWLVWAGVHIFFLIGFANRLLVLLQWAIAYLTKRRQVRILTNEDQDRSNRRTR